MYLTSYYLLATGNILSGTVVRVSVVVQQGKYRAKRILTVVLAALLICKDGSQITLQEAMQLHKDVVLLILVFDQRTVIPVDWEVFGILELEGS